MECQKIANLLDSELIKPSKFRTRNWVEINDNLRRRYSNTLNKLDLKQQC